MLLSRYLKEQSLTVTELAKTLGLTVGSVVRLALPPGHASAVVPKPDLVKRIYNITGGAVTPNDFYVLDPQPKSSDRS